MRGMLIVNPRATTTSDRVTDVIVHALAADIDLEVVRTAARDDARELGARAARSGLDLVFTLGGDGTVNETVNGMLDAGTGAPAPALGVLPGGSANVLARALGRPTDPIEATGLLLEGLREGRRRTIGLGRAHPTGPDGVRLPSRWFLVNAGLGIDAEIIDAMEQHRARGHEATPARYLRTTIAQFLRRTDRRDPALRLERPGAADIDGIFFVIVANTAPWTYLGPIPVDPCPRASFDTDLDVFALRRMGLGTALRAGRRFLAGSPAGSTRRSMVVLHDQRTLVVRATRPIPAQVDGEPLGPVAEVAFTAVPAALTVID